VQAFVRTFAADDPLVGAQQIVRIHGFGPFVPNTILLGETEKEARGLEFARFIQLVHRRRRNLIVVRERRHVAAAAPAEGERRLVGEEERPRERLDVWWRGDSRNMNFILALVVLLRRSPAWRGALLRLKVIAEDEAEAAEAARRLEDYVREQRLRAEADVILRAGRELDGIIRDSSRGADLVFLGLRMPAAEETAEQYAGYYRAILARTAELPPTVLVMASEHVDFERVFRAEEAYL
jgi:hypothetical protein